MKSEHRGAALLSVAIDNREALQAAHMPFVVNGGLFIPTTRQYRLGEEVFVLLRLMDDASSIPLAGKVVWITPEGALGGKTPGIGVQFGDKDDVVRQRIKDGLADHPRVGTKTYTM